MPPRKIEPERVKPYNPLIFLRHLMAASGHLTPDLRETLIALFAHKTSFLDKDEVDAGRFTFTSNATQGQLARYCHIQVRGVARRLNRLQAAGVVYWDYTPKHAKGNDYTIVLSRTDDTSGQPAGNTPYGGPMEDEKSVLIEGEVSLIEDSSQSSMGVKSVLSRTPSDLLPQPSGNYPGITSKQPRQEEQGSKSQGSENPRATPREWPED
jgi:hypothetical protein